MAETRTCPTCGAEITDGGACVPCLLRIAVECGGTEIISPIPTLVEKDDDDDLTGKCFNGYKVLELIGQGGMGKVYKTKQLTLDRFVALKTMLPRGKTVSDSDTERFHRESRAVARLQHPNIVAVYESGKYEGRNYFTMEWIEGGTLDEHLASFTRDLKRSASLLIKVAKAVHYVHQRGILHRDLKPGNILFDSHNEPRVSDFGLVKLLDPAHASPEVGIPEGPLSVAVQSLGQLTRPGQAPGTPAYMAPEQAEGKTADLTTAIDVWSLGVILYQMVTGRLPFDSRKTDPLERALEILSQVATQNPKSPTSLNSQIDKDLEAICLKCLEKPLDRRYGSAEALAQDLERWLRIEPVHARPVKWHGVAWSWVRRHRTTAALGAAVAVSILLGWAGIVWQRNRSEQQHRRADDQSVRRRMQRAEAAFDSGQAQTGLAELATLIREDGSNRVAAERLLNALRQHIFLVPSTRRFPVTRQPLSSDRRGNHAASVENLRSIRLCEDSSGAVLFIFTNAHAKVIRTLRFSSDGGRLVSASGDTTAKVWDLIARRVSCTLSNTEGINYAEFSPDGSQVVTASRDETAQIWNLVAATRLGAPMHHDNSVNTAHFSPDGARVLTAADDDLIRLWDVQTSRRVSEPLRLAPGLEDVRFIADAQHVVVVPERGQPQFFRFTRDLDLLASPRFEETREARNLTLFKQRLASSYPGIITYIDLSPDRTCLATASFDKTVRLWNARTLEPLTDPLNHNGAVNCVRFSPDGLRLVTSTAAPDQTVRVWDAKMGLPLSEPITSPIPVAQVGFSDDGNYVTTSAHWRWEIVKVEHNAPEWLADLALAVAGLGGPDEPVAAQKYLQLRENLLRNPETNRPVEWAKAFLKDEDDPGGR